MPGTEQRLPPTVRHAEQVSHSTKWYKVHGLRAKQSLQQTAAETASRMAAVLQPPAMDSLPALAPRAGPLLRASPRPSGATSPSLAGPVRCVVTTRGIRFYDVIVN